MKQLHILTVLLLLSAAVHAQNAKDYFGGWSADIDGIRHIYYIVLRDGAVTGYYCHDCDDPANLAFIDDGSFTSRGLSFTLYHYPADGHSYTETVTAVLTGGDLAVTRQRDVPATAAQVMVMHRGQPAPNAPPAQPQAQVNPRPNLSRNDWVLPGPAETITPASVAGIWLWGSGPGKQLFIFRQHKDGLRGMVCGPCDNVTDMAPLEKINWSGTKLHFEIIHEDNGFGYQDFGPFSNIADAVIAKHEMHLQVMTSYNPPNSPAIEMVLLGPVNPEH